MSDEKGADRQANLEKDELRQLIRAYLDENEQYFTSVAGLKERAFHAARYFVKDRIVEVGGDTLENFETKKWFALIYYHVHYWYQDHYGAVFEENPSGFARGVVLVRNVPVELKVPLTKSKIETPGETSWLYFPDHVGEEEKPLLWLINPPPVEKLAKDEQSRLIDQATVVANALRTMYMYLNGVAPHDEIVCGLLEGVSTEVQAAARFIIVRSDDSSLHSALWALQMAVERTLKAFSQHKTATFRESHDLFVLYDDAAPFGLNFSRELLKRLPRVDEVIAGRYGLRNKPELAQVLDAYHAALEIIGRTARLFGREIKFANAGFLLKKMPFISFLVEEARDEADKKENSQS